MRSLMFDTATTGRWLFKLSDDSALQPHLVRLAMLVEDAGEPVLDECCLVQPNGWEFEPSAIKMHGITPELAAAEGRPVLEVWTAFLNQLRQADVLVAFNTDFHLRVMERTGRDAIGTEPKMPKHLHIECAMRRATDLVQKPRAGTHGWAWPKMTEAYQFFTGSEIPHSIDPVDSGRMQVHAVAEIWHGILDAYPGLLAA